MTMKCVRVVMMPKNYATPAFRVAAGRRWLARTMAGFAAVNALKLISGEEKA